MFSPSVFFKGCANHFGWPGKTFVRAHEKWKRPIGVQHPTIRRIDWSSGTASKPGEVPLLGSDSADRRELRRVLLFVWAHATWRSFVGPQLESIILRRPESFDGRECNPFVLGYVRGAAEQLVDAASPYESGTVPGFIRISVLADVFGLEWIDDLDDAISELASGRLSASSTGAFDHGAGLGMAEMERYLDREDFRPGALLAWFEETEPEASGPEACEFPFQRARGAARTQLESACSTNRIDDSAGEPQ